MCCFFVRNDIQSQIVFAMIRKLVKLMLMKMNLYVGDLCVCVCACMRTFCIPDDQK